MWVTSSTLIIEAFAVATAFSTHHHYRHRYRRVKSRGPLSTRRTEHWLMHVEIVGVGAWDPGKETDWVEEAWFTLRWYFREVHIYGMFIPHSHIVAEMVGLSRVVYYSIYTIAWPIISNHSIKWTDLIRIGGVVGCHDAALTLFAMLRFGTRSVKRTERICRRNRRAGWQRALNSFALAVSLRLVVEVDRIVSVRRMNECGWNGGGVWICE